MAKTLLQKVEEALAPTGVTAKEVRVNKNRGIANTAVVTLQNGREISVNMEDNWEEKLQEAVIKFDKKKPINTKEGDKA